jgi:hypothetical protein
MERGFAALKKENSYAIRLLLCRIIYCQHREGMELSSLRSQPVESPSALSSGPKGL